MFRIQSERNRRRKIWWKILAGTSASTKRLTQAAPRADVGYNPNEIDEEKSDGKILAGTSASTKRLTQAAPRADARIQSERNGRRKIAEREGAAGQDGTARRDGKANHARKYASKREIDMRWRDNEQRTAAYGWSIHRHYRRLGEPMLGYNPNEIDEER